MKKITALILSAAIPLNLCACTYGYQDKKSSEGGGTSERPASEPSAFDYETADIDRINDEVKELLNDLKTKGNEKAVQKGIETLLEEADKAFDAMSYSSIASNVDFYNEELQEEYDANSEALCVIQSAVMYAFAKGINSKYYSELFEGMLDDDALEYFGQKGLSLSRVEGYASVDYRASDDKVDEYYEIAYDKKMKDKEKNLKCAEIYLDILSNQDPETFYENYYRDYSPEEILEIAKCVKELLIPVSDELYDAFGDNKYAEDVYDDPIVYDDIFGTILDYSPRLSKDIEKSAKKINDEELYTIASGDECYTGSYTVELPSQNSGLVYIYSDGSFYDLTTAIHEFGHFHASLYDETPAALSTSNIDVAEIQSQAMELLFMQFYDEMYGDQADAMRLLDLYDTVETIISSFLIGEFEYTALTRADDLTAEDVVDLYDEIMGDYAEGYPFYYIAHMFEYPGYYISYGVSALAALDILDECLNAPEKAVEMYEKIAKIPSSDRNTRFKAALSDCGYSDVLTEEYIQKLAKELTVFAKKYK